MMGLHTQPHSSVAARPAKLWEEVSQPRPRFTPNGRVALRFTSHNPALPINESNAGSPQMRHVRTTGEFTVSQSNLTETVNLMKTPINDLRIRQNHTSP